MTRSFGMGIAIEFKQITLRLEIKVRVSARKTIEVYGVTSEIHGFFYRIDDGFPTCLYDFRETGK